MSDSAVPPNQVTTRISIVIDPAPPPAIATSPPPATGAINLPYVNAFNITGHRPGLTWSTSGPLPPGFIFNPNGILAGTPTALGAFPLNVTVQDDSGQSSRSETFTIDVVPHGFSAAPFHFAGRTFHTATLLTNGQVLIVGGIRNYGTVLFDPSNGWFTSSADLEYAPYSHTATLLNDGKVLVAGGRVFQLMNGSVDRTQTFDPASGEFSRTGSLNDARYSHTATLLDDGTVLITGGVSDAGSDVSIANAEVYDPASETFGSVGNMTVPRSEHTATLLSNGDVLIVGGIDDLGRALATAEIYNSSTHSFTATGSMTNARCNQGVVALSNGNVLVVGGIGANALATAELYDSAMGTFSVTGNMGSARSAPTATRLDDTSVLVTGGSDNQSHRLSSAELYDVVSGSFTPTGSMTTPRDAHQATLLGNGQVLVTGEEHEGLTTTAELYQ